MKTKMFLLCVASAFTASASAADPAVQIDTSLRTGIQITESERIQAMLEHSRQNPSTVSIGHSGFNLSGPLVYGFRKLPPQPDLTRAQKFLRLPVIRLFVPGPMPNPPESGGKYFAWRSEESRTLAWTTAANRVGTTKGPESRANLDASRMSIHP